MNEESLFNLALEKPPHERSAFLDTACGGDVELRRRVERLLKSHDDPGSFLQEPIVPSTGGSPSDATQALEPGVPVPSDSGKTLPDQHHSPHDDLTFLAPSTRPDAIGRLEHYHVLQVIGKGGFGTVLKAFDEKLHRVVAIKILAPELAASGTARQHAKLMPLPKLPGTPSAGGGYGSINAGLLLWHDDENFVTLFHNNGGKGGFVSMLDEPLKQLRIGQASFALPRHCLAKMQDHRTH